MEVFIDQRSVHNLYIILRDFPKRNISRSSSLEVSGGNERSMEVLVHIEVIASKEELLENVLAHGEAGTSMKFPTSWNMFKHKPVTEVV